MSMVFMDSCGDGYSDAEVALIWDTVSATAPVVQAGGGRNETNGLKISAGTGFFAKTIPSLDEYFVGVAFRLQDLTTPVDIVEFNEGATNHVRLSVLANGAIEVSRNGTALGTSAAGTVIIGSFTFIEIRAVIHDSAGIVTVDLDEFNIHTLTSQDTKNGGAGLIDEIRFNGTADIIFFDDVYVNNNIGSAPQNGFLGNTHIDFKLAGGDGSVNDFTILEPASPTTHFTKVNENPPDLDVSFVASDVPTDQELFTVQSLGEISGDGSVFGVQVSLLARKNNEGPRQLKTLLDPGVSIAEGSNIELATIYSYIFEMWQQNPDTAADWAESEVDAIEIGCEVI